MAEQYLVLLSHWTLMVPFIIMSTIGALKCILWTIARGLLRLRTSSQLDNMVSEARSSPFKRATCCCCQESGDKKTNVIIFWLWLFSLLHLPYLWYPHILWVIVCNLAPSILVADRKMHFLLAKIASECAVQPHWPFKGLKDPFWYLPRVGPIPTPFCPARGDVGP